MPEYARIKKYCGSVATFIEKSETQILRVNFTQQMEPAFLHPRCTGLYQQHGCIDHGESDMTKAAKVSLSACELQDAALGVLKNVGQVFQTPRHPN